MQILISREILGQLIKELQSAGSREIGGLLFAEHVGGDTFQLVEISVQTKGGTQGSFVRDPVAHQEQLRSFFERTGENHTRFNYLGEWHSHPSFHPAPSSQDMMTMTSILNDPLAGVNFVVLLILRRKGSSGLELSATVFHPEAAPMPVRVFAEAQTEVPPVRRKLRAI